MPSQITFGRSLDHWSLGDLTVTRTFHSHGLLLPTHDHEPATLVVVLDGAFRETVGRRIFDCERGTVLLKPRGAHHSNRYRTASTSLLVTLPPRHDARDVAFVHAVHTPALTARLCRELAAPDAAAGMIAEGLVLELLGLAVRAAERSSKTRPAWLRTVAELIHAGDAPSLAALAAAAGRHPSHVAREFRRHFGCSPGEYDRALRIERACDALRTTNDSIAEIAAAAGFYDQSHFTSTFRRRLGITPASYRKSVPIAHRRSKTEASDSA
ncbi:MAG TPA: helix-turn-helix transcriptional regulator [Thermoanaerobaculia bacterium]|nr:helix-turn-helix transcriptional regulator [Thermoanaerobaculia bacterium]